MTIFHENRHVGKAVYGLDTEILPSEFSLLSGLSTIPFNPFNIILKVSNEKAFNRPLEWLNMYYIDGILHWKGANTEPTVLGMVWKKIII